MANWAAEHGHEWMRCDGKLVKVSEFKKLNRYQEHDVEVITKVLSGKAEKSELSDFVSGMKAADKLGKGSFFLLDQKGEMLGNFSTSRIDPDTGMAFPELDPKHFSWNSSRGWCATCHGYGKIYSWLLEEDEGIPKSVANLPDGTLCPECNGDRPQSTESKCETLFKRRFGCFIARIVEGSHPMIYLSSLLSFNWMRAVRRS